MAQHRQMAKFNDGTTQTYYFENVEAVANDSDGLVAEDEELCPWGQFVSIHNGRRVSNCIRKAQVVAVIAENMDA